MAHFTSVLLPAPFSPSSAWKAPAWIFTETSSSAASAPKRLEKPISSSDGALTRALDPHAIASITAVELATAPNTPPCISTIFSAAA